MGRAVIKRLAVGMLRTNCWLLADADQKKAAIIDPGENAAEILKTLETICPGAEVTHVLHTHGHFDHVGAGMDLQKRLAARGEHPVIAIHAADVPLYEHAAEQGQMCGVRVEAPPAPTHLISDHESFQIGSLRLRCLETPGHSPGGVCFLLDGERGPEAVFSGDTLFRGTVGRSDLWGGDADALLHGIHSRLLSLPDETRVLPGHGDETTIGAERVENELLR